jgi:hypothetical protein
MENILTVTGFATASIMAGAVARRIADPRAGRRLRRPFMPIRRSRSEAEPPTG